MYSGSVSPVLYGAYVCIFARHLPESCLITAGAVQVQATFGGVFRDTAAILAPCRDHRAGPSPGRSRKTPQNLTRSCRGFVRREPGEQPPACPVAPDGRADMAVFGSSLKDGEGAFGVCV